MSALITDILLAAGLGLELIAVLGLVVMRDVLDRLHFVGLAGFGALLVGISVLSHEGFSLIGDKALAVGVVLVTLGPVVVHVTARSMRLRAFGDWRAGIEEHVEQHESGQR